MAHSAEKKEPLGVVDVGAGVVFFLIFAYAFYALAGALVPGLFSSGALVQALIAGGVFLVFWFLVGADVFTPYFDLVIEREARTVGDEKLSHDIHAESRRVEKEIEDALRQARLEGVQRRDRLVDAAKDRAAILVSEASEEAEAKLVKGRAELEQLTANARTDIEKEAAALADLVLARALGPVSSGPVSGRSVH
jgi:F0F1-type ATP synthase membrane subunit b/b'